MKYKDLHLEAIMIPEHIDTILHGEAMWEMELPPFSISVVELEVNGKMTVNWTLEFSPSYDFDELNDKLEDLDIEADGYGWTDYILQFAGAHYPQYKDRIYEDSESDTCCLYTSTRRDFNALLIIVSESIRQLYVN